MLVEFSVSNYRSIKDEITLSFEATSDKTLEDYYVVNFPKLKLRLLRVGMLYGPNASGKTNILRALELVREIATKSRNRDEEINFTPYLFSDDTKGEPGKFRITVVAGDTKYIYELKLTSRVILWEKLTYYPSSQPALVFERHTNPNTDALDVSYGSKIKLSQVEKEKIKVDTIPNRSIVSVMRNVNIGNIELMHFYAWFRLQWLPIVIPSEQSLDEYTSKLIRQSELAKEFVLDQLSKADFSVSDVFLNETVVKNEVVEDMFRKSPSLQIPNFEYKDGKVTRKEIYMVHHFNDNDVYIPLPDESAGTQRYFCLSGPMHECFTRNALLFIDELESSLHPDLIKFMLMDFLKRSKEEEKTSQLLFTTHNVSLLEEKDMLRQDVVWFTDKKDDGSTELFSLDEFDLRKTHSYYKAYRIGKLGAVPNINY